MSSQHDNLIAGVWVTGQSCSPNVNPSNLAVAGERFLANQAQGADA